MPTRVRGLFGTAVAIGLVLAVTACASGEDETATSAGVSSSVSAAQTAVGSSPDAARFASLLSGAAEGDHEVYYDWPSMLRDTDVVARVRLVGVAPGRSIFASATDPDPAFRTDALAVEIVEVLGGKAPDLVSGPFVVEVLAPYSGDQESLAAALPEGSEALVFLTDYTTPGGKTVAGDGVTGTRYLFPHTQGFYLDDQAGKGGIVNVLGGLSISKSQEYNVLLDEVRGAVTTGQA